MKPSLLTAVNAMCAQFETRYAGRPCYSEWAPLVTGVLTAVLEATEMAPLNIGKDDLVLWVVNRVLRTFTPPD